MEEFKKDTPLITEEENKKALSLKEENKRKIDRYLKMIKELRNENKRLDKKQESRQTHLGNHLFRQSMFHHYIVAKKQNDVTLQELSDNSYLKTLINELRENDYFKRLKYTDAEFDLSIEGLKEYIDRNNPNKAQPAPSAEPVKENVQSEPPKFDPEQSAQTTEEFLKNLTINNPKEYHF